MLRRLGESVTVRPTAGFSASIPSSSTAVNGDGAESAMVIGGSVETLVAPFGGVTEAMLNRALESKATATIGRLTPC